MTIQDARHQTPIGRVPGKRPPLWTITLGPFLYMWRAPYGEASAPSAVSLLGLGSSALGRAAGLVYLGPFLWKFGGTLWVSGTLLPPESVSRALRVARVTGSLEGSAGKPLGASPDNQT